VKFHKENKEGEQGNHYNYKHLKELACTHTHAITNIEVPTPFNTYFLEI